MTYIKHKNEKTEFVTTTDYLRSVVDMSEVQKAGFYPVVKDKTHCQPEEGKIECLKFELADDEWHRSFIMLSPDDASIERTPCTTYSVCELFWWVAQHGKAKELDALLESQGLYSAAITQTTVSDDDPNFTDALADVKTGLGLTDEEVADALASARLT